MSKREEEEEEYDSEEDNKRRRLDEPNTIDEQELAPPICHDHDDDTDDEAEDDDTVDDDYAVFEREHMDRLDDDYAAYKREEREAIRESNLQSMETHCCVANCSRCHNPHFGYVRPLNQDDDMDDKVDVHPHSSIVMEKDDRMPRELVERVWALPDILVTVHKPGKDSSIGVVQQVLSDGSFKIALGSSGNGEVIIAVKNEIEIVAPRVSDKVKIMATSHRGATGKVIDIEEGDAIVRLDGDTTNLILKMSIVAKLA